MKLPATLLLFTAIFGLSAAVRAETSPISARVEQESKTETSKDHLSKTARRTLKVTLSNSSKEEVSVKVKYTFFGHGAAMGSHDILIVDSGDRDATIKPSGSEVVETPATSVSFTEEHYEKGKKTKTEATGNKIIGYAVQVFAGDKMVAEAYDPAAMKDQVGKAPVYKKPEPKK